MLLWLFYDTSLTRKSPPSCNTQEEQSSSCRHAKAHLSPAVKQPRTV